MNSAIAFLFILMSVVIRLLPHPWNVSPVVGVALFSGAFLPRCWALPVALLAVAASDVALGWLPVHLFGWAAVALAVLIGGWLRGRRRVAGIAARSLLASTLFFLFSNFGVWFLGCVPGWYPQTPAGLAACYMAGVPFFRNGLAGDLAYTLALFGLAEAVARFAGGRVPVPVSND